MIMKQGLARVAFLTLLPGLAFGQAQSGAVWHFAKATWGCSLNLAIRDEPDANNSLSNVELSYLIASTNPPPTFRISENELAFSVNLSGYEEGEAAGLTLSVNGVALMLDDRQFANRLHVYTASSDQARYIFESMESGAQIVVRFQSVTGEELIRTLHEAGFDSEAKQFRECSGVAMEQR